MNFEWTLPVLFASGAAAFFWIGVLGLLWRRSLIGMLVGLLFCWVAVGILGLGLNGVFSGDAAEAEAARAEGSALVLCIAVLGALHGAVGLGIIVARIKRRGTLDADDAGLLEG